MDTLSVVTINHCTQSRKIWLAGLRECQGLLLVWQDGVSQVLDATTKVNFGLGGFGLVQGRMFISNAFANPICRLKGGFGL